MGKKTKIKGMETITRNFNKEIKGIVNRSAKGLIKAALLIRVDMEKNEPKVPVDTGNLRASWRVVPFKSIRGPYVVMGFTANYALFVHEMVDATFNRKGSGAKFFSSSLKRNKLKMLEIIRKEAEVKS